MPSVLISHAGSNSAAAAKLKTGLLAEPELRAAGLKVWLDKDDLEPGAPWKGQIEDAMASATACIVVVGGSGVVNWVEAEVDIALSRAVEDPAFRFIPVLIGAATSSDLTPFARRYHAVRDPLEDKNEFAKLRDALLAQKGDDSGVGTQDLPPVVPYPGLRSMSEPWSDRFFGRATEVGELLQHLRQSPIVSIVAASGAGKSSLAMAGLSAAWRGGLHAAQERPSADDPVFWNLVYMRPRGNALEELRQAVRETAEQLGRTIEEQSALRNAVKIDDASSTLFALECALPAGRVRTLLVLDQAEELVTASRDAKAREDFGRLIGEMIELGREDARLRVVLTVRDDYANRVHSVPGLDHHARQEHGVLKLALPEPEGLAQIIEAPLKLARFDDTAQISDLKQTALKDLGADRAGDMALLQMALHLAWRDRDKRDGLANAYRYFGGVSGALGQEAERISEEELEDKEKALLTPVFMRLVRLGETSGVTRRIAKLDEFDKDQRHLIDRLSGEECGRLLQVSGDTVEIAHESLISQWPELAQSVDDRRTELKTLHRLTAAADCWKGASRVRLRLATRAEVEDYAPVQRAFPAWLSSLENAFLSESKRWLGISRAATIAAVAAVVGLAMLSAVLFSQAQTSQEIAELALARAEDAAKRADDANKTARQNRELAETA